MNAIDTNVLVYLVDDRESVKQAKADDLVHRLTMPPVSTILLWQVIAEFVACMRRWQAAGRLTAAEAEAYAQRMLGLFPLVLPNVHVVTESFHLTARHSLSHWDAMLLAACIEAGVTTLYSEDLTDAATYDTVTVVNPFA
jgi:predicted nucleic acid-binding protein